MSNFLETFLESRGVSRVGSYLFFAFEPFHNVNEELSKLAEANAVRYFSSERISTGWERSGGAFLLNYGHEYSVVATCFSVPSRAMESSRKVK